MVHKRVCTFNTCDTCSEQNLDNNLCQAVVANNTVYLRDQVAQDLDSRENVAVGDPAGQAEKAMENIALLLEECGSRLDHVVSHLGDRLANETMDSAGAQPHVDASGATSIRPTSSRRMRVCSAEESRMSEFGYTQTLRPRRPYDRINGLFAGGRYWKLCHRVAPSDQC